MPKCSCYTIDNFGFMSTKRSIKIPTSKALRGDASRGRFQHAIDFLFLFCDFKQQLYIFLDKREDVYMSSIKMPKFEGLITAGENGIVTPLLEEKPCLLQIINLQHQ